MKSSRLILFAARWAIMSGLAGTVFAVLVFSDLESSANGTGHGGMLLASATFLSIAFILAPFVRWAFAGPPRSKRTAPKRKTLLDEMRQEGDEVNDATESLAVATLDEKHGSSSVVARLLIALYVVFGVTLVVVLGAL